MLQNVYININIHLLVMAFVITTVPCAPQLLEKD